MLKGGAFMKKAEKNTRRPIPEDSRKDPNMYTTDPMGSYTGRPVNREEKPVQDADDL